MIRPGLLPHTITVITAVTATDDYGNTVLDYGNDAERREVKAYVRPAPASEDIADRNAVTAAWQVHTNDLGVGALDRVEYEGDVYEIDGQPLVWRTTPAGRTGHSKFLLRKVAG